MSCPPVSGGGPMLNGNCWFNWHGHYIVGCGNGEPRPGSQDTGDYSNPASLAQMEAMLSLSFDDIPECATPPAGNYGFRIWVAELDVDLHITGYHEFGDDPGDSALMLPARAGEIPAPATVYASGNHAPDHTWYDWCVAPQYGVPAPGSWVTESFDRRSPGAELPYACDFGVGAGSTWWSGMKAKIWTPGKVNLRRFKWQWGNPIKLSDEVIADHGANVLPFEVRFHNPEASLPNSCLLTQTCWFVRPYWACGICSNWMEDYCQQ